MVLGKVAEEQIHLVSCAWMAWREINDQHEIQGEAGKIELHVLLPSDQPSFVRMEATTFAEREVISATCATIERDERRWSGR